ncbi:hypothetical protein Ancab_004985 [Ancistrocladus abbreviatus]
MASQAIAVLCPNSNDATVWEEQCQLRVSDQNFFGRLNITGNISRYNPKKVSNPERFRSIVNSTLLEIAEVAAFNSSAHMYATKQVAFSDKDNIYSLVQCTPDLSPEDCNLCIQAAIVEVLAGYQYRGARLLSCSCYLSYEFYAFYAGQTEASISSESSAGKNNQVKKLVILLAVTGLAFVLAAVILRFYVYFFSTRKRLKGVNGTVQEIQMRDAVNTKEISSFLHHKFGGVENPFFDLATIWTATDYFSDANKLGEEYAMEGIYSIKSDVFSFGIILLEILTGRKGIGFHLSGNGPSLQAYAWKMWGQDKGIELMDHLLIDDDSCHPDDFLRCVHVGLLCVQEDAFERPTMSSVVNMLKSETVVFGPPKCPAFSVGRFTDHYRPSSPDVLYEDRGESALISALAIPQGVGITEEGELVFADELPSLDLNTIRAATDDFSDLNKLGQGGFGIVYAGVLCDGTKIAVKRLSRRSSQGIEEFKNEIILIAKLQHRNLVRLLDQAGARLAFRHLRQVYLEIILK